MRITFKDVTVNQQTPPFQPNEILHAINLTIEPGSITAIVGPSGAGKTSLLKTMNGLMTLTEGSIQIGSHQITPNTEEKSLMKVRKEVGSVFQFPETQLFSETVEKDICFGPLNFGMPFDEAKKVAREVLLQVGLTCDLLQKSPFQLSGGEKRRVAIAGVLAMKPKVLVLDEPGAGLDPEGKGAIFSLLLDLNRKEKITIIFTTHDMDDVVQYAQNVIVMDKGNIIQHETVRRTFENPENLINARLELPEVLRFQLKIEEKKGIKFRKRCLTVDELADLLIEAGFV